MNSNPRYTIFGAKFNSFIIVNIKMDIEELNGMIAEHLRHYGLRVAARVVEEEVKKHNFNLYKQPSPLVM